MADRFRRFQVPAHLAISVLIFHDWLVTAGARRGLYSSELAANVNAVSDVVFFAFLIWWHDKTIREKQRLLEAQMEQEFEIQQERDKLTSVVTQLGGALVMMDPGLRVEWMNEPAQRLFGPLEQQRGRHCYSIMGCSPKLCEGCPAQACQAAPVSRRDHNVAVLSGERRAFDQIATAVRGKNGALEHVLLLFVDITERKRMEDELRIKTVALARSNADLELFAQTAAHDLREPLRKITGFGDLLARRLGPLLDEQGRADLARIQEASARMGRLIDALLALARVSTGPMLRRRVDTRAIVLEAAAELAGRIQECGARVEVGPLPAIEANPVLLRQLFVNLIGNAVKYRTAHVPPRVRVSGRALGGGRAEISVEDNGIGFDERFLDRIFKPFERLHGPQSYEGAGIGLAICKRIVERHDGTITARGKPGEGATFIVTLPCLEEEES